MAGVKKIGNRWYVVHGRTKAPIKRKGRRVGFSTKGLASAEVERIHRRMGIA